MFILNSIKSIFFLLVLCHYASANKQNYANSLPGSETYEIQPLKHISDTGHDREALFKRIYKPKGTEVEVPHLSELIITRGLIYSNPLNLNSLKCSSSFLHYTPGKRGPPSV